MIIKLTKVAFKSIEAGLRVKVPRLKRTRMFEVWRDLPFFINLSNFFRYAKLRENSSQGVETSRKSPHLRSLTKVASGILVARSFKPHVCKALHEKHIPVITHYAAPDVKPRHFYGCRHLTLCSRSTRNRANKWSEYPVSKLQGKWMHNAGFRPGQTVEVKVYHQKLIVRVVRQREENFPDKGNW